MGREIRRVPPNWEHPKEENYDQIRRTNNEHFIPLYDESCESAWLKWHTEFLEWQTAKHDELIVKYGESEYPKAQPYVAFCRWNGKPPEPSSYRPSWDEEIQTWWQVYETVSEGTPVTPPFKTQKELVDYLIANGDFWDQSRRESGESIMNCKPWPQKQAESFVYGSGWAPTLIKDSKGIHSGVEALCDINSKDD